MSFAAKGKKCTKSRQTNTSHCPRGQGKEMYQIKTNKHLTLSSRPRERNVPNQDKQTPHTVLAAKGKKCTKSRQTNTSHCPRGQGKEMYQIKTNKHLTLSSRPRERNVPNQDKQTPHTVLAAKGKKCTKSRQTNTSHCPTKTISKTFKHPLKNLKIRQKTP